MFNGVEIGEYGDDGLMLSVIQKVLRSPAKNNPRSGLLQRSGGRLVQSLAVLGKNEYLCMFILDRGNIYLDLMDG